MNVFGIGLPEIAVIGALALLVFGPKRLPELGKTLGKTLKGFQSATNEFEKEIKKAMEDEETTPSKTESSVKQEDLVNQTKESDKSGEAHSN